jgi:secreted PhoX family phosphatase
MRAKDSQDNAYIGDIIDARYSRRAVIKTGLFGLISAATWGLAGVKARAEETTVLSSLTFTEIVKNNDADQRLAEGYSVQTVIRWGDAVMEDAPPFVAEIQNSSSQKKQFGYNNDFVAYMPLPKGSGNSEHGLLCVNHEYVNSELMLPEEGYQGRLKVDTEMAAHGLSVVEVKKVNGYWNVQYGEYNRRMTADTLMEMRGPAAGSERLITQANSNGKWVLGTLANCAGGKTPWGTVLSAEENIQGYFHGAAARTSEARNHKRYGIAEKRWYDWHTQYRRFNVEKEPNEPNRFGWVVEYDPYDAESTPIKRTALGRFSHESATVALSADNRVVVYSGDDANFEYLYRYVSRKAYREGNDRTNQTLLDDGVLYVAKFEEKGALTWLPLLHGEGELTEANGFNSQADVLIETRRAADLVGATKMDRPEDIEVNAKTGEVFVVLTRNIRRMQTNPVNRRRMNWHGHILKLTPPTRSEKAHHAAEDFRWDIFLEAGDPDKAFDRAYYKGKVSPNGWLSAPDNIALDQKERLWIATDGQPRTIGMNDGLYVADTSGEGYGIPKLFYTAPRDAEVCGPEFTPDNKTLFLAIQHPGAGKGSSYAKPSSRWPDFQDTIPPRPSIIAITSDSEDAIGGSPEPEALPSLAGNY